LADLRKAPLAIEVVRRIDAIFTAEREINGATAEQRLAFRNERVKPLVSELEAWMRAERARLSRHADLAKAIDYMLKRWPALTAGYGHIARDVPKSGIVYFFARR
jgi:transposase